MAEVIDTDPFDPSAALAILDGMLRHPEPALLATVVPAWEAAWIACLTNSPAWAMTSATEFASVVTELRGVVWVARQ